LSSPDNPQFEPQPSVSAEQIPVTSAPDPFAPTSITAVPTAPPTVENPVWDGWDVLSIVGLTLAVVVAVPVIEAVIAQRIWYSHDSFLDVAQKLQQMPSVLIFSQFLIYIPVAACMVALVEGKYRVRFWQAIRWNWPRAGWRILALGAVMFFFLSLLQNFLPMPKDTPFEHLFDSPRDAYLLSIIAVTLGPLMEELFFRGFMYPVLARRMGLAWGVALTALPFGLIHLPQYGWAWGAALVIFLVGIVCGVVRAVTRSVGASFLVHAGFNGTQMLIAMVMTQGFRHMPKA